MEQIIDSDALKALLFGFVFLFLFAVVVTIVASNSKKKKVVKEYPDQDIYQSYIQKSDQLKMVFVQKKSMGQSLVIFFLVLISLFLLPFCFPFLIVGFILWNRKYQERKKTLKETCFKILEQKMNRDFHYLANQGLKESDYIQAKFESYDTYSCEDYLSGQVKTSLYYMSEVCTQRRYEDAEGHTSYTTIFHGVVSYSDLSFDTGCTLYISNDFAHKLNRHELMLENEIFQKEFNVYSDNEVKAFELLTPDIMEKILELKSTLECPFEVKIVQKRIYFRFFTGEIFEATFQQEYLANKLAEYEFIILKMEEIMQLFLESIENVLKP